MLSFQQTHALQGGRAVNASDYPGLVMLSYDGPNSQVKFKNCTGILLENRRVLTTLACIRYLGDSGFSEIPATNIYVHPITDGEIGGSLDFPTVNPSITPNVRVSSYVIHPQNSFLSGAFNLAILRLASNLDIPVAAVYDGSDKFVGKTSTSLGWHEEQRQSGAPFSFTVNYFVLNQLTFPIVDGNTNIDGLCYDNFSYTGTVFCGGFRNSVKFLEFPQDEGSPIYRTINGRNTIIGLLTDASHGQAFEGIFQYEKYTRISSMVNFIKQNAPNTQFWNETNGQPKPKSSGSIIPILQLLLLDK